MVFGGAYAVFGRSELLLLVPWQFTIQIFVIIYVRERCTGNSHNGALLTVVLSFRDFSA